MFSPNLDRDNVDAPGRRKDGRHILTLGGWCRGNILCGHDAKSHSLQKRLFAPLSSFLISQEFWGRKRNNHPLPVMQFEVDPTAPLRFNIGARVQCNVGTWTVRLCLLPLFFSFEFIIFNTVPTTTTTPPLPPPRPARWSNCTIPKPTGHEAAWCPTKSNWTTIV